MLGQSQLSHTLQCPRLTQVGCPSGVRRQLPPLLHLFRLAPAFGKTTMVSTTLPTGTWYKSISIESERRGGCLSPHQKLSSSWLPLTSCTLLGTWLTGSSGQVQPITTLQTGSLQSLVCLSIRFYFVDLTPRNRPISVHQPRLIVTKIPWIGSREHRWIVNAIQEKYYYVHILGKWYPTDFQPLETKKRALRSSGAIEDRLDMTVNQFFNIIEDGLPPSKRQRKPLRRIAEPQLVSEDKRPRGAPLRKNTITTPQHTHHLKMCRLQEATYLHLSQIPTSADMTRDKPRHLLLRVLPTPKLILCLRLPPIALYLFRIRGTDRRLSPPNKQWSQRIRIRDARCHSKRRRPPLRLRRFPRSERQNSWTR